MGLFSFSQYGLLNESQRLRLQRARSHRCHRQPPDSACAHGDPPRAPPSKGTDRYNLKRASFVSMMCIRAVVRLALFHGPRTDARCSHR